MKPTPTQLANTDPTEYQRRIRELKQLLGHQLTHEAEEAAANYGWRIYRRTGVDPHLEHEEDVVLFGQSISERDLSDYWVLSIEPLETRKICTLEQESLDDSELPGMWEKADFIDNSEGLNNG